MKNILTLTLVMLLLFGFSGCREKESPTDYEKNSSPEITSKENIETDNKNNEFISQDKAKQIALAKARVTESKVKEFNIELDFDDDTKVWEYDMDFEVGLIEYECDIDAKTGKIIKFKSDVD